MKLATLRQGDRRDGALIVVDAEGERYASAKDIAPTMQAALDHWEGTEARLRELSRDLSDGKVESREIDFEKLGPGMAIALLTTFYGLMLAHLLYLPISRMIRSQGDERAENLNLIIEAMLKLSRRRPIHEVQQLVRGEQGAGGRAA